MDSFPHKVADWLLELHEKIWHQKELQHELFHMKYCRRIFQSLTVSSGVLSAKLAVLRSIPEESGLGHPTNLDNKETVGKQATSIMISLGLQVPPPRMPLPLLVGQEYNTLSKMLAGIRIENRNCDDDY
jgi:hypothetical protein